MRTTRVAWLGVYLIGGVALGLALLAILGAVLAGWLPWPTLPGAWLGANALVLLLALHTPRPPGGRRVAALTWQARPTR
jgi:hypothetical protein